MSWIICYLCLSVPSDRSDAHFCTAWQTVKQRKTIWLLKREGETERIEEKILQKSCISNTFFDLTHDKLRNSLM